MKHQGFSLGVRAGVCLSPAWEQPGIPSIAPRLPVSLATKGFSCRLDSALGSSCPCPSPHWLCSEAGYAHLPRGKALLYPACLLEAGLAESSLQPALRP